jgi:hypothetical protein
MFIVFLNQIIAVGLNQLISENIGGFLTIVGSLLAVSITGFFSLRRPKKSIGERENAFIDQQQEENIRLNARIDELAISIKDLNDRLNKEMSKSRSWMEQYYILLYWVLKGGTPPHPELPDWMKHSQQ